MSSATNTTSDSPSSSSVPVVFITGATGTQGLNLATILRSSSYNLLWTVRATVRDPSSPAALRLASLGVHLTRGSWDDVPALTSALSTCTHLFLNTIPSFTDPLLERRQTSLILHLAKSAGVKHVIFSSALVVDRLTSLDLFQEFPAAKEGTIMGQSLLSKAATESTLKSTGFQYWTILRGASFMENYLSPKIFYYGPDFVAKRKWKMVFDSKTEKIPLVDTLDIAKFAVQAFLEPERFHEREITISGEFLGMGDIVDKLSSAIKGIEDARERHRQEQPQQGGEGIEVEVGVGQGNWRTELKGKRIEYIQMTEEEIEDARKVGNPFVLGQLAIKELGKFVSVEESKSWGIKLNTFDEFLEREWEAVRRTYCAA